MGGTQAEDDFFLPGGEINPEDGGGTAAIVDIERGAVQTPLHKSQSRVESGHHPGSPAINRKQSDSALSIGPDQRLAIRRNSGCRNALRRPRAWRASAQVLDIGASGMAGLGSGKPNVLAVGEEPQADAGDALNAWDGHGTGLSRGAGQDCDLRRRPGEGWKRPFARRRGVAAITAPQLRRGRTMERPGAHRVNGPAA